jgi:hypothetical protein
MENSAVEWLQNKLKKVEYNPLQKNGYTIAEEILFAQAKEMEETQRKNDFIGGYLTHAMKKNKLPYGIQYLNKVADIEKQGEKLYNKTLKSLK